MKKLFAMILCLVMVLSLVACGETPETTEATATEPTTTTEEPTTTTEATEEVTTESTTEATEEVILGSATDAVEVLKAVMNGYNTTHAGTDFELHVVGGGYENSNWEGPDVVPAADTAYMGDVLLVPEAELANIEATASAMHSMMINNFCAGAYNLVEGADVAAFATAMQAAIQGNQWVCGFPEQLVIADVGGCVIVVYGNGQIVEKFSTAISETYPSTTVLVNEAIAV